MSRVAMRAVSPKKVAKPGKARGTRMAVSAGLAGMGGAGGYDGARLDRANLKNWRPRAGSPDADTVPDLEPLRSRARDLARNAPLIAGALDTHLTCMVGPGLIPHPRIDRRYLKLTDAQADAWQAAAARYWWAWAGQTRCDMRRRANFAHLTWIIARSWMTSGDVFVRRRFVERPGDLFGLKLQVIEADRVSNPRQMPDTSELIEGVELDADGAASAFQVQNQHPGDYLTTIATWSRQPAFGPQTGEPLMLQIGLLERDGQTRPVTMFAPVIEAVKQLTRYAGAELDAAVVTSFISAVITSEVSDDTVIPSMGTGSSGTVGIVGSQGGPASAADEKQIALAPAAMFGLAPGEKLESFNPSRPNSGFDSFFRAFCSIIGVAIGLPHELLIKHFTSSYSASRGALLEAWRSFKTKRSLVVVDQFAQPTYTWLITEAVARGYLEAPGFFASPLVRQAYLECQWSGPIMGQLNPQQEVSAAETRVDMGVSTLEEETAELTGGDDWELKHFQRAKEHKMRVAAGLEPDVLGVTTKAAMSGVVSPDAADAAEQDTATPPSPQPPDTP